MKSFGVATSKDGYVEALGALGRNGRNPQNVERELHKLVSEDMHVKLLTIRLPIRHFVAASRRKRNVSGIVPSVVWLDWPIAPFWQIIQLLVETDSFEECVHPDPKMAERFWTDFSRQSYAERHSIHQYPSWQYKHIVPFHIHVDGVRIFKSSGMNTEATVISASSALVRATSLRCKFALTVVPTHLYCKDTNSFLVAFIIKLMQILKSNWEPRIFQGRILVPGDCAVKRIFPEHHLGLFAGLKTDMKEKQLQHGYRSSQ
jgi:hypothetical protein